MKQFFLFSLALVAMCISTLSLSAAVYCDATITSENGAHSAQITCSSLGGNQYQFVFVSADAFKSYNADGSNFYMNVNGVGGYQVSKNLTQDGNTLSVVVESNVAPTIYVGDFFVLYDDGEAWFKIPTDADFSQACEGSGNAGGSGDSGDSGDAGGSDNEGDSGDSGDSGNTDTPDTPQAGSCSGTSTGVDPFYTNANPQHAVQSLEKGFNWTAATTAAGVAITVEFLDNLPGMAAPYLFTFNPEGVLIGDPIQMSGWDAATRTATHTLTGLANGYDLVFLVQVALEGGKILFTERVLYTVGTDCSNPSDEDPIIGSCSGNSKGVDEYYTSNNAAAGGSDVLTNGYDWSVATHQSGNVDIEVEFLDYLPGIAAPQLFLFKNDGGNEVLDGDPIPMRWMGLKAFYTLENQTNGAEIVFLVQIAYEMHVLFTERIRYTVGNNCQEDTALEQPTITTTARKVVENGQIYIIHNGIRYNALGTQIK